MNKNMINIQNVEIKQTKTGKEYKFLKLEGGVAVSMWSDDPDYATAVEGAKLDREVVKEGAYNNLVKKAGTQPRGDYKAAQIEKTIVRKEQSIEKAQHNKENSIKVASTMSGAVALAVADFNMNKASFDTLEELVVKYRKFLWEQWDKWEDFAPF